MFGCFSEIVCVVTSMQCLVIRIFTVYLCTCYCIYLTWWLVLLFVCNVYWKTVNYLNTTILIRVWLFHRSDSQNCEYWCLWNSIVYATVTRARSTGSSFQYVIRIVSDPCLLFLSSVTPYFVNVLLVWKYDTGISIFPCVVCGGPVTDPLEKLNQFLHYLRLTV